MNHEDELIKKFYQGFWIYLSAMIAIIIAVTLLVVFRNKLLVVFKKSLVSKIFLYLIIAALVLGDGWCAYQFTLYGLDKKNVDNRQFLSITGKVIDYNYIREGNSPNDPITRKPIVQKRDGETIVIDVLGTKKNEVYTIIYLKHTKLGVIAEQNTE